MKSNFKFSNIQYKKINPYKFKDINIYSIEEALFLFYNNWEDINFEFFEDRFISWVKDEILDIEAYEILLNIKNLPNFYEKSITFLRLKNFYKQGEIENFEKNLKDWERKGKAERLKIFADTLFKQNYFEKAIITYNQILSFQSDNYIIYNNIAICYFNIFKYNIAINYFEKAFILSNKDERILENLLDAIILDTNFLKFKTYISFIKEYDKYYYFLAEFQKYQRLFKNSLSSYTKVFLFKRDKKILLKICDIYISLKDYEKALKIIQMFEKNSFYILIKESIIYEHMEEYKKAIKCLEIANFYKKNDINLWIRLSKLYRLDNNLLKAEAVLFKAKSILKDYNVEFLFEQAILKKTQGKFDEYKLILNQITKINKENYRKYNKFNL